MRPASRRDRETLRRALLAGGVVWALAAAGITALSLSRGLGPRALPGIVAITSVFGGIAASGWLWLAALLDVLAGHAPSRRRWLWAVAVTVLTFFLTPLALAALAA